MILGALIDAGLDLPSWKRHMETLPLDSWSVTKRNVRRNGIAGTKLTVNHPASQPHRNLADIRNIINSSDIPRAAVRDALGIFRRLAKAEADAHGVPISKIHFHEVGAIDSIVDIVGAALAIRMMGIKRVVSSPLNLGSGTVKCAHGVLPVPAPATARLVEGFPAYASETKAELTTPTGAAILTTLADSFGPMPLMRVEKIGHGAGDLKLEGLPNLLRVFVGETEDAASGGYERDSVTLIETNIDDMDPRICEYAMERLFEAGALDVWLTPIVMKKSRPAVTLSVLCEPADSSVLTDIVLAETTTFGVRVSGMERAKLARRFEEVEVDGQSIRVKLGIKGGKVIKRVPEYEDAKRVAKKTGRPLKDILPVYRL
jgi:hypothetical protein